METVNRGVVVYKDKGSEVATSYKPTWQWRIDQSQNAPFCLAVVTNAISRRLQLHRSVFGRILLATCTYMYLKVHVRKGHISLQTNRTAIEPVHHHRFSTLVSYMILGMVAVMNAGLYPVQTIVH